MEIAERRFYVCVVLRSGLTLQVALVVQFDHLGERCNFPRQGGVFSQQLVMVSLPLEEVHIWSDVLSMLLH